MGRERDRNLRKGSGQPSPGFAGRPLSRDAIAVYREQIGPIVEQTNNEAYAEAAGLLRRVEKLMNKLGEQATFQQYLNTVRTEYKRKRNFMKLLEKFGCRFYLGVTKDELKSHFDLVTLPDLIPRYNIAPSQDVAAVLVSDNHRELKTFRWGLIPFWAKDEKIGYHTTNAKAENADTKPSFRAAFKYRRCLIPASGFFGWKTEKGVKLPFCIRPKRGFLNLFRRIL